MQNELTYVGQSIEIGLSHPISKVTSIIGFTSSITGITGTRTALLAFRYSTDSCNWSEWTTLSTPNLTALTLDPSQDFDIEYRVTRTGSDTSGVLAFNWITLDINYAQVSCPEPFINSVFSNLIDCNSDEMLSWCSNVLRKVYEPGIVSKVLVRNNKDNEDNEDRDYIDFWRSISCLFALYVLFSRKLERFEDLDRLLEKYIEVKGLYNHNDQESVDSLFIMNKLISQYSERGTIREMLHRQVGEGVLVHPTGELLRLISFHETTDEFLYNTTSQKSGGWTVGKHSPLYKGVIDQKDLIKTYYIKDDLTITQSFPLINSGSCSYVTEGDDVVIRVNSVSNQMSGIGTLTQPLSQFLSIVSPNVCYEISFLAKVSSTNVKLTIGLFGYNSSDNPADPSVIDILNSGNIALNKVQLPKANEYYLVRVIIFPSSTPYINDSAVIKTSLNKGSNLVLNNSCVKVIPRVVLDNTSNNSVGSLYIKNFAFKVSSTNYSKGGLINNVKISELWIKNNSQYDDTEVSDVIRDKMIPYRSGLLINNI